MHPELAALLREARRQPEDDPARLVLADWLEENGDEKDREWAELIRTEVLLAALHPLDYHRRVREDRARALRSRRHGQHLLPPRLAPGVVRAQPSGGLCRLALRPSADAPVDWAALRACPLWPSVDGFSLLPTIGRRSHAFLSGLSLGEATLREVLDGPIPEGRGFLGLNDTCDDDTATALVESPGLAEVTTLDLTGSGLGRADSLSLLLASPRLAGLAWLVARDSQLSPDDAEPLAATPHLPSLRHLELGNNHLGPAGADRLGRGHPRPAHLGLALNHLGADGVLALLATPLAPHLRSLDLSRNGLGDRGAALLAAAPQLSGLERLYLNGNGIGPDGSRALAESPHLGGLSYLYIYLDAQDEASQSRLRARFGDRVH